MKEIKNTISKLNGGRWIDIQEGAFTATILRFDEPSQYGIKEGRISKLYINENGNRMIEYDRAWVKAGASKNASQMQAFYEEIIKTYN